MRRAVFCYLLVLSICLAVGGAASGQTKAKPDAGKACPFSIVGLWRAEGTTEMTRLLFDFSPRGHITMLEYSPDRLPQDFEMVGSVNYKLDKPRAPKEIEFINTRGNDAFLPGITLLDIVEYGENSFTTREPATGRQTRWTREKMRRYFLTLAARSGPPPYAGPAFAMLTLMDGRRIKVDALGVRLVKGDEGKMVPVFGQVPAELYDQVREESEKDKKANKEETLIMRLELTQAEFESVRKVLESWERLLNDKALPHADPYLNATELLRKMAESLHPCGEKVNLHRPTQGERDEIAAKHSPSQHPFEYIKVMRKKNGELHISDAAFPWQWRPLIEAPGH